MAKNAKAGLMARLNRCADGPYKRALLYEVRRLDFLKLEIVNDR